MTDKEIKQLKFERDCYKRDYLEQLKRKQALQAALDCLLEQSPLIQSLLERRGECDCD